MNKSARNTRPRTPLFAEMAYLISTGYGGWDERNDKRIYKQIKKMWKKSAKR